MDPARIGATSRRRHLTKALVAVAELATFWQPRIVHAERESPERQICAHIARSIEPPRPQARLRAVDWYKGLSFCS